MSHDATERWQRQHEAAGGRSRADRIRRLRERVKQAYEANREDPLPGILQGMLDLLEDEL